MHTQELTSVCPCPRGVIVRGYPHRDRSCPGSTLPRTRSQWPSLPVLPPVVPFLPQPYAPFRWRLCTCRQHTPYTCRHCRYWDSTRYYTHRGFPAVACAAIANMALNHRYGTIYRGGFPWRAQCTGEVIAFFRHISSWRALIAISRCRRQTVLSRFAYLWFHDALVRVPSLDCLCCLAFVTCCTGSSRSTCSFICSIRTTYAHIYGGTIFIRVILPWSFFHREGAIHLHFWRTLKSSSHEGSQCKQFSLHHRSLRTCPMDSKHNFRP